MNEQTLSRHIGEVYELVERPESLPGFLKGMSASLGSVNTNLCTIKDGEYDYQSQLVTQEFLHDTYLPIIEEDPWFVEGLKRTPPLVHRGSDLVPDRIYRKSIHYDINRSLGFEHMVSASTLSASMDCSFFVSSARWPGRPDSEQDCLDLLSFLLPHLNRAFRLRENNTLSCASFSAPAYQIEGGRVVDANVTGQAMLGREPHDRWAHSSKSANSLLESLIQAACVCEEPAIVETEHFSAITLPQSYLDKSFVRQHCTLVIMLGSTEDKNESLLSRLSSAERAVVELLSQGLSINEIAALRTRSPLTVRTQVKSAMRKANVRSQAQLLIKVLEPISDNTALPPKDSR